MFDLKKIKDNPNVSIFSRKKEILTILKNFAKTKRNFVIYPHSPELTGSQANNDYSSEIINIDEDIITIDSLMPRNGNLKMLSSTYLKINFNFNNKDHYFLSKLYNFAEENDYFNFNIYTPLEIYSIEKRRFFRIEPAISEPIKISFFWINRILSFNVYDISGEGLSFLSDFSFEKYTVIENMKLEFPKLPSITVRAEIKICIPMNSKYKIGLQIINIKPAQQDIMFKYIFKRQRELVAREKGL
jgi:c-di-GMP-binding flagellar brake protein YcgR